MQTRPNMHYNDVKCSAYVCIHIQPSPLRRSDSAYYKTSPAAAAAANHTFESAAVIRESDTLECSGDVELMHADTMYVPRHPYYQREGCRQAIGASQPGRGQMLQLLVPAVAEVARYDHCLASHSRQRSDRLANRTLYRRYPPVAMRSRETARHWAGRSARMRVRIHAIRGVLILTF